MGPWRSGLVLMVAMLARPALAIIGPEELCKFAAEIRGGEFVATADAVFRGFLKALGEEAPQLPEARDALGAVARDLAASFPDHSPEEIVAMFTNASTTDDNTRPVEAIALLHQIMTDAPLPSAETATGQLVIVQMPTETAARFAALRAKYRMANVQIIRHLILFLRRAGELPGNVAPVGYVMGYRRPREGSSGTSRGFVIPKDEIAAVDYFAQAGFRGNRSAAIRAMIDLAGDWLLTPEQRSQPVVAAEGDE